MRMIALFLTLSLALSAAETTPEQDRESGLAALRAAQADPDQIVVAAKLLTKAADGLAKAGKDAEAQEVESYLFWCKKKMTLQQIDAFLGTGNGVAKAVVAKLEQIEKKEVKPEDAKSWLAKADAYAAKTTDQFLVAVRYFEIASRFKETDEGKLALDKSLKALQAAKVDAGKAVVGKAEKGDGKVYVQSVPAGADVLVKQGDELRATGVKTPGLAQLPKGPMTLVLRKDKFEDAEVKVVIGDAIVKPEPVKLEPPKFDVEVTVSAEMGEGWTVFVDGKPALEKKGKAPVVPCTVLAPEGAHAIQVAKDGFVDPSGTRVSVKTENVPVEIKGKPQSGPSKLFAGSIAWDKTYLSSMSPVQKKMDMGMAGGAVSVKGKKYPNGIFAHPLPNGGSLLAYDLGGRFRLVCGTAAVNDTANFKKPGMSGVPLTFRLVADGKTVWTSKTMQSRDEAQEFRVNVVGVQKLELIVESTGSNNAHAVWADPYFQ